MRHWRIVQNACRRRKLILLWFVFGQLSRNLKRWGALETLEALPWRKLQVSFLSSCILKPDGCFWFQMAKPSKAMGGACTHGTCTRMGVFNRSAPGMEIHWRNSIILFMSGNRSNQVGVQRQHVFFPGKVCLYLKALACLLRLIQKGFAACKWWWHLVHSKFCL